MIGDVAARAARLLPPETAHAVTIAALKNAQRFAPPASASDPAALTTEIAGLRLPNPVGLAAGFDKHAEAPDAMLAFGFGFVECGSVTPRPQPGNPRPRLFRLTPDRAVINRFGFNSQGLEAFAARLEARKGRGGIVGANLGANKTSEDRAGDYVTGLERLNGLADFFTVNVSSPNTPGLRGLQDREALTGLLDRLAEARARAGASAPMFLKVAPDLDAEAIDALAQVACASAAIDALVVSNTTLMRPATLTARARGEAGGLSGRPLFELSTRTLKAFRRATGGGLPLIGVGGVENAASAYAKIRAGASAVELYTALVFEGPGLVRRITRELAGLVQADGFASVADAVGADAPL